MNSDTRRGARRHVAIDVPLWLRVIAPLALALPVAIALGIGLTVLRNRGPSSDLGPVKARAAEIARDVRLEASGKRVHSSFTRSAELRWFRTAPFGLFIHYGPSSRLAAPSEFAWTQEVRSPRGPALTQTFDPDPHIADGWVRFARAIGASYLTVTVKHHDGFALWATRMSSWSVDPRHDLLARLAVDARHAHIRLFIYFSTIDWHDATYERDFTAYVQLMRAELRELLTHYGAVAGVWFDGLWDKGVTATQMEDLYRLVHTLQPWALVGDNTHERPLPGQDFQIYEGGFPGDKITTYGRDVPVSRPVQAAVKLGATWFWDGRFDASRRRLSQLLAESRQRRMALLADIAPAPDGRIAFRRDSSASEK
jgi:alpha-L-fucosidase